MAYSQRKTVVLLVVGISLTVIGVIFILCFQMIFSYLLRKEIALVDGTIGYRVWQDIPLPIYQKLFFFNITNPEEFVDKGMKPKLKEVGPYTFCGKWVKEAISWHENGTVSYREIRTYQFVRNQSIGTEDDVIITLNAPLLMAATLLKNYDTPLKLAASLLFGLTGEHLITKKSVKQLAYGGYKDIIIALSPLIKHDIPFKNGVFSWFYKKNATDDGLFTVFTGESSLNFLNIIDGWNGKNSLEIWDEKACNMINGSNGEVSPPVTSSQKTFSFFQSVFCRSMTLSYSEDITHVGIPSKRFMATKATFANGTENPNNACFSTEKNLPSGVQDISKCQYGAPVVISFPHFYLGDPSYLKDIDGLQPNASLHNFHIDVEPITGLSVDLAVRFQVNLYLQKIHGIIQLERIPKLVFPVFWVDVNVSLTKDLANDFKAHVFRPQLIAYISIIVCITVGCLLTFSTAFILSWVFLHRKKGNKESDEDALLDASE